TTKAAGRGLGLAVVQGIVRNLGGAIQLVSEPGQGTTFHILLPCDETKPGATQPAARAEQCPVPTGTILIVEDENTLRAAVTKMLRRKGFEVLEAANGSDAIDLLRAGDKKIDAMLLDMTLPGHSGREVFAAAREAQPALTVILTSAYPEN